MLDLSLTPAPPWFWFVVAALATWRISHLLQAEDGPGDVVVRLRAWAGDGVLGRGLDCFNCVSVWVSLPLACVIGASPGESLLFWPALSGMAILVERATARGDAAAPEPVREEENPCPVVAASVRRSA